MRSFYFAVALVASFGPASADGVAFPGRGAEDTQTEPSRLYQAGRVAAETPSKQTSLGTEPPLAADEAHGGDAASGEVSDALKAKVRAIIAFMRDEASSSKDGELLASRIRVRCASKQVVTRKKSSLAATPSLMLSGRATAAPEPANATTVEACTLKLVQVRRGTVPEPSADSGQRDFSFELPPLDEAAP